eukprot:921731-Heterocapsa_arctica.AAC.1
MLSSPSLRSHMGPSRLTLIGHLFADLGHGEHGRLLGSAHAGQGLRVRSNVESAGATPRATIARSPGSQR